MVGLPYPNIKSPELQEKMAYLDHTLVSTFRFWRMGRSGESAVASRAKIGCHFPTAPAVCSGGNGSILHTLLSFSGHHPFYQLLALCP